MTKLIKKVAAMAAAVIMMGTMSIGASASTPYTFKTYHTKSTNNYISTSMTAFKYKKSYKRSVQSISTCIKNGSWYMNSNAQLWDKNRDDIVYCNDWDSDLHAGASLNPSTTYTSSRIKYAVVKTELRKNRTSKKLDQVLIIKAF